MCHLTPESAEGDDASNSERRRFEVFHFRGEWRRGRTSGGCGNEGFALYATNPQFFVNLSGIVNLYLNIFDYYSSRLVHILHKTIFWRSVQLMVINKKSLILKIPHSRSPVKFLKTTS